MKAAVTGESSTLLMGALVPLALMQQAENFYKVDRNSSVPC